MIPRKLTPTAIIPPELYVRREADRQLRLIIDSAARPATVLVARQMGKTNLLLNAKRELEDASNAFIYVDLSIPLTSDRDCFRNIIDTAIETRTDLFESCRAAIHEIRDKSSVAAFTEHEMELRVLLSAIKGKLIIILDEIDSLAKGAFSDKVFAQIRRVYFSRVNYPQYGRLTYVLSGVLEPNEIIKDKRISPFNIAEKIYLDDFKPSEFDEFMARAGLQLSAEIKARIYYWSNGNPRITWDICADLEDKVCKGYILTQEEVDHSVQKLYLKDFNQAPVDHIRELVASDDDLRNAITQIKFNRGHTLSDETKNKLYLGGIIGSGKSYKDVQIKNPVIEAALSDRWLHDIGVKRKGLLKLAEEHYDSHKYAEALSVYEQFLEKDELPEEKNLLTYYHVGSCAYHIGDYAKALKYLSKSKWDKDSTAILYYDVKLKSGICNLQLGNIKQSQSDFREIMEYPKKDSKYLSAIINYGSSFNLDKQYLKAIEVYNRVISEISTLELSKEEVSRTMAATYFNLAHAMDKSGDKRGAKTCLNKAVECCLPEQKPTIIMGLVEITPSKSDQRQLLNQCVEHIINNNILPITPDPERVLALTKAQLLAILSTLYEADYGAFQNLFEHVSKIDGISSHPSGLLYELALLSLHRQKFSVAADLAKSALHSNPPLSNTTSQDGGFETLRLLCHITKGNKRIPYVDEYLDVLKSGFKPKYFGRLDLDVFLTKLNQLSELKKYKEVLDVASFAKRFLPLLNSEEAGGFVLFYVFQINAYGAIESIEGMKRAAHECIEFIDTLPEKNGSEVFMGDMSLSMLKEWARSHLMLKMPSIQTAFAERKYGRNEKITVRYNDGTIKADVKFKKVEEDLKANKCVIV